MKDKIVKFFTYSFAILGILLMVLFLLWGVVAIHSKTLIPRGIVVGNMKGIWLPEPVDWWFVYSDIDQIKNDGVNTISIGAYSPNHYMSILVQPFIAQLIKKAHNNDLAVHLVVNSQDPNSDIEYSEMKSHLTKEAIYWAKFAKKYHVEYFSPQNDNDAINNAQASALWAQEILPEVRQYYKGQLILKLGSVVSSSDLEGSYPVRLDSFSNNGSVSSDHSLYFSDATGYDYLMFDAYPQENMADDNVFLDDLSKILEIGQTEVTGKNLKGLVIGEFGYATEVNKTKEEIISGPLVTSSEQSLYLGQFLDTAMPSVGGVFHNSWNYTGYQIKGSLAEEVLKTKFTEDL